MRPLSYRALLAIFLAAGIIASSSNAAPKPKRVTAVVSSRAAPYLEHLEGFKSQFDGEVEVVYPGPDSERAAASLKSDPPDLVFAIGSSAAELAAGSGTKAPVLFSMVYYPKRHGLVDRKNVSGISLRVPPEKTLEALEAVKPRSIKSLRIGVLYPKDRDRDELSAIKAAVGSRGHILIVREVESSKDVGQALKSLLPEIDVLWLVADPIVLPDPEFMRVILSEALDAGAAVVGLSDAHVEMGALVSVSVDYRLEGEAAAKTASKIVSGSDASATGILPPQSLVWSLNQKVAGELGWPVTRMTRQKFERVHP